VANRTWLTGTDLDRYAEGLATEYRGYLIGLVGTLAGIFERPNAKTSQARTDLTAAIREQLQSRYDYVRHYIESASVQAINAAFDHVGENPLTADEMDELYSINGEAVTDVVDEVLAMMTKDATVVRRAWRQFAMDANLRMMPNRGPRTAALLARQGKIAGLKFRQTDTSGRQWESAQFARLIFRLHLVRLQVETTLYLMKKKGIDTATAEWADGRQSVTFSIADEYMELRDGLFHPNSTARIA
jgi:hypothetical protein